MVEYQASLNSLIKKKAQIIAFSILILILISGGTALLLFSSPLENLVPGLNSQASVFIVIWIGFSLIITLIIYLILISILAKFFQPISEIQKIMFYLRRGINYQADIPGNLWDNLISLANSSTREILFEHDELARQLKLLTKTTQKLKASLNNIENAELTTSVNLLFSQIEEIKGPLDRLGVLKSPPAASAPAMNSPRESKEVEHFEEEIYQQLVKETSLYPDDAYKYYNLGLYLANCGKFAEAEKYLNQALDIKENTPCFHFALAQLHQGQRNFEKALVYFERTTHLDSTLDGLNYHYGLCYYYLENYDSAIKQFSRALMKEPQDTNCLYYLAMSYLNYGNPQKAIERFIQLLKKDHQDAACYFGLAQAYRSTGKLNESLKFFKAALKKNPDAKWSREARTAIEEISELMKG